MANSKTASKKTGSKKASSKKAKSKKEPKLKVFCGITQPPKGHKIGSMKECLEKKQVRYYGIKKIDSRLVDSVNDNKASKLEIISKMASLRGRLDRLKKDVETTKNTNDKKKMIEDYQMYRKEILMLNEKLQKMK